MTAALTIGCRRQLGLEQGDFDLGAESQGEIIERDRPGDALPLLRWRRDIRVLVACLESGDKVGLRLMRIVRRRYPDIIAVALFDVRPLETIRATVRTLVDANLGVAGADSEEGETTDAAAERHAPANLGYHLTARQQDVLYLIRAGLSNKQIARVLDLSEGTVKIHCMAVFRELEVDNRTQAALFAERLELYPPMGYDDVPAMGAMRRALRTPLIVSPVPGR